MGVGGGSIFLIYFILLGQYKFSHKISHFYLAYLEPQAFGGFVILVIVQGGKQSQLLVCWTWLGLEFDENWTIFAFYFVFAIIFE